MREILFRGKSKDGIWIEGQLLKNCNLHFMRTNQIYIIDIENKCNVVIPETVGQFTEMLDKNGVKLFEGDIAINGKGENVLIKIGEHGIIDEDDENIYYGVYIECNKTKYPFVVGTTTNFIEVIGNIHDNQELLKK